MLTRGNIVAQGISAELHNSPIDLQSARLPIRLALVDADGVPRIVSLWFRYRDGRFYCATHQSAWIVKQLRRQPVVGYEISTNDPPYRGTRGTGRVRLDSLGNDPLLQELTSHYLGDSNASLASWLLSRQQQEIRLEITPQTVSHWDYSNRMSEVQVANG